MGANPVSLVKLVARPGQLTAEFRDGQRARSINPWRLAFNVIAVFFVLSFVTDFRIANFPKQDPSGELAAALKLGARQAGVDDAAFVERIDRRFNAIYTALVTFAIGAAAIVAWLTHLRNRQRWNVHFVFALHLTAWSYLANLVYYFGMRALGLPMTYTAQTSAAGAALLGAIVLWQWGYVVVAFRRVYADRAWSAALKSAAMVVATFFVNNAVVLVSFWVALATASIAT
jgi:hypothetical protein